VAKDFVGKESIEKSGEGQNTGEGLSIKGGKWGGSKAAEKLSSGNEGVKGGPKMGPMTKKG